MQKVHNLCKYFLGFILPGNITELNACCGLHIHLCIALSKLHGSHSAAKPFHHFRGNPLPDHHKKHDGKHPADQKAEDRRHFLLHYPAKFTACRLQSVHQLRIIKGSRSVISGLLLIIHKINVISIDLDPGNLLLIYHVQEGSIINIFYLLL